ncbi:MAG TPA: hypothetical protein VHP11_13685, partial [Tepidisphaeraceae bacterium]|nr:hypothetical protein [Tepidisphaeraceae bacterium]
MATAVLSNPILQRIHQNRGLIFPMAFISLLFVILVPLPTSILDILLVLNLSWVAATTAAFFSLRLRMKAIPP